VVSSSQPVDYIAQTRVLPWSLRCNLTEKKNRLFENFWDGSPAALTVSQNKIPQQDYNFILALIFKRIISTLIFKGPFATKTSLQANKEPVLSSMVNVLVLIRNLCIVFLLAMYLGWTLVLSISSFLQEMLVQSPPITSDFNSIKLDSCD